MTVSKKATAVPAQSMAEVEPELGDWIMCEGKNHHLLSIPGKITDIKGRRLYCDVITPDEEEPLKTFKHRRSVKYVFKKEEDAINVYNEMLEYSALYEEEMRIARDKYDKSLTNIAFAKKGKIAIDVTGEENE